MNLQEKILEYIDQFLTPALFLEIIQLKTNTTLNLIAKIIKESNKTIPQAVGVFLAVTRYLCKDPGLLQEFIEENPGLIFKMAVEKKGQANLPGRGLPLLEIFEKKIQASSILVIELGASYGLIGRCLLNPARIIEKKDAYFSPHQQMPRVKNPRPIDYYLGIELSIPDREWVLAWEWLPEQRQRLQNFLRDITGDEKFKLLKGNAFGFSKLKVVKELSARYAAVVVLTSYMLHQYEEKKQQQLKDEILEFIGQVNGHWLNQTVNKSMQEYFIQLDGEKIIRLSDDSCRSWKFTQIS